MGLLKQSGQLNNKSYASLIGLADEDVSDDDLSLKKDRTNITKDDDDEKEVGDGSELLLNELQVAGCMQVDKLEVPSYQSAFRWQDYTAEEYLGNWCD
ncbi:pentatricopeptide repeat-containing protein [Prunus yedoensis var. nudiflora]|uniref:Pentatricopeptide repeat-containing protein n=1 Tax=Prunus yedoensis var. nudiflora TaxID=2094558 RepID=A0A314Y0J8_PRUYE|nr:pentatricopeptide repeat-containing protein [Prunus yedoensis var. nudiflora]